MRDAPLSTLVLVTVTATLLGSGCELAVQLDRSLADAGVDLCTICSDAGADDGSADSGTATAPLDGAVVDATVTDATVTDAATADGPVPDGGAGE